MKTLRMIPVALAMLAGGTAAAQTCEVSKPIEGQRLLRRLSVDLRGQVPSYEEQALQSGHAEVSNATVGVFLESPGFLGVMRAYHANMLWPNIDNVDVAPLTTQLYPIELSPGGTLVYFSFIKALYVRSITAGFTPCADKPAQFDSNGKLVMEPLVVNNQTVAMQEGWVEVEPYWAPGTKVKVCGLDAQPAAAAPACTTSSLQAPYMNQLCQPLIQTAQFFGVSLQDSPVACDTQWSFLAEGCGCGPNLRSCTTQETAYLIRQSFLEQELRMVDRIVAEERPYTELLLDKKIEMNGYLAHYLRYQSRMSFDLFGEPDDTSPIPAELDWTKGATWISVTRGGRHSGVLTAPGYLMKFQSDRARAHRYYNAFECSSFSPNGPLPSASEACSKELDLTKRCGCDACHVKLEPLSANWGRFAEYGFTPLDEARYPTDYASVCTNFKDLDQIFRCVRFYQTEAKDPQEQPYVGDLRPYVFKTDADRVAIEQGPSHAANDTITSGRFAMCTVRRMWTHFMRRAPTAEEEQTLIPELAASFKTDGYRLRGLVKSIVTQPAYGRLP